MTRDLELKGAWCSRKVGQSENGFFPLERTSLVDH